MRQIFFAVTFAVTLIFAETCAAQDVWVEHWQSKNLDIYAMDDTLKNTSSGEFESFTVSTKYVQNGQLVKIVDWEFLKHKTDIWRYENSEMDGTHVTVVIPRNGLFEFCMDKLGCSYQIIDILGLKRYE